MTDFGRFSHPQLANMIGPASVAGVNEAADTWQQVASRLGDYADALSASWSKVAQTWTGSAADQFGAGVRSLVTQSRTTAQHAASTSAGLHQADTAMRTALNSMPPYLVNNAAAQQQETAVGQQVGGWAAQGDPGASTSALSATGGQLALQGMNWLTGQANTAMDTVDNGQAQAAGVMSRLATAYNGITFDTGGTAPTKKPPVDQPGSTRNPDVTSPHGPGSDPGADPPATTTPGPGSVGSPNPPGSPSPPAGPGTTRRAGPGAGAPNLPGGSGPAGDPGGPGSGSNSPGAGSGGLPGSGSGGLPGGSGGTAGAGSGAGGSGLPSSGTSLPGMPGTSGGASDPGGASLAGASAGGGGGLSGFGAGTSGLGGLGSGGGGIGAGGPGAGGPGGGGIGGGARLGGLAGLLPAGETSAAGKPGAGAEGSSRNGAGGNGATAEEEQAEAGRAGQPESGMGGMGGLGGAGGGGDQRGNRAGYLREDPEYWTHRRDVVPPVIEG